MDRVFKLATLVCAASLIASSDAIAVVPDCDQSQIPNVIATPDSSIVTRMRFFATSPFELVQGALVELRYSPQAIADGCWCAGQPLPSVFGVTDSLGYVEFRIAGGGCLDPATIAGGVVIQVYVDNILCKEIGQVSPDVISTTSSPCVVSLADAVDFTKYMSTATFGFCYDLNSDGTTGIADGVLFSAPTASSATCP